VNRAAYAVVLLLLAAVAPQVGAATGHPVVFRADDGRMVNGLIFESDQKPAPAVILVPMYGRTKDDWLAAGQRLSDGGLTAVALDLPILAAPNDTQALAMWTGDVRGAVSFLVSRPETLPGAVGIIGASFGGTIAAMVAGADTRVKALALVSPSIDYRGVRIEAAMRQYGPRPAFLLGSAHDPYAARSARDLAKDAPGPRDLQLAEATAHGTLLLSQDPDLVRVLLEWFHRVLG
jgi:dienelactone hydrolase